MPRLFSAIEVPNDIAGELHRLRAPLPGARWITPESYHITLRFAGDIGNAEARELKDNLARIETDGFELRLSGLGVFGGDNPHSLWAGIAPEPKLDDLARAHEKAARNSGLPPETRAFRPHVTLARLRHTDPEAIADFLTRHGDYRSEPFFVTRIVLMSARPSVGGGPYGIEDAYPVRGLEFLSDDGEANW